MQRAMDHCGVEMAGRTGIDRVRADAGRLEPARVVVGGEIAGERADAPLSASARAVASSSAVLPAPGEPMTLIATSDRSTK